RGVARADEAPRRRGRGRGRSTGRSGSARTPEPPAPASRGLGPARSRVVNHLEHVAVHRIAEEEALERRGAERCDQLRATLDEALLQRLELSARVIHRHVASELPLERRYLETVDMDEVR